VIPAVFSHRGPGERANGQPDEIRHLPVEKQALCLVCENGDIDIKNRRMDNLFLS